MLRPLRFDTCVRVRRKGGFHRSKGKETFRRPLHNTLLYVLPAASLLPAGMLMDNLCSLSQSLSEVSVPSARRRST